MDIIGDRLRLPPRPDSAGRARAFVTSALTDLGHDDLVEAARMAVSEVVTNAVLHARTDIEVRISRVPTGEGTPGVRVDVWDGSPALPALRDYGGYATTGRGLGIVAALTAELGVEPHRPFGKRVWFLLDPSAAGVEGRDTADAVDREIAGWARDWDVEDLLAEGSAHLAASPRVQLEGLPVRLWQAAQQHHDAALRELGLYRREHPRDAGQHLPDFGAAKQAEAKLATAVHAALTRETDPAVGASTSAIAGTTAGGARPRALSRSVDVELMISDASEAAHQFAALKAVLDEAEGLAAQERLLVRPALPEVVALRNWCCREVTGQAGGAPPTTWMASAEELIRRAHADDRGSLPRWDDTVVHQSQRCVLAADDRNRIVAVSRAAAALLGWPAEELTGRRIVDIIPARLREAHVAGFTRYLTTGESAMLGVPLELPVLCADGREVACQVLIEHRATTAGPEVFLAWLDPRGSSTR